jgi:hypothetical protein
MLRKVRKRVAEVVRVYVQRDEMFRDRKLGNFTALDDQSLTQPPKEHRFPASANGSVSSSAVAKGLYPKPPQLATDAVEDDPEGVSFWKIKHGIRWTGMPSWKDSLSDQQIWTLALFLKHMDKLPPGAQSAWQQAKN